MDINKRIREAAKRPNMATRELAKRMQEQIDAEKAKEEANDPRVQYSKGYRKGYLAGGDAASKKWVEQLNKMEGGQ